MKVSEGAMVPNRVDDLECQVAELERQVADLTRHNLELRETVKALLAPTKAPVETMGGRIG
jgi:hypothetical protein